MGHCLNVEKKKHHFKVSGKKQEKMFKYPEVVYNHYKYRDCIDNHNSQRMHPLSMEETWMMMHWPNCVFCFLLAVTMVNVQNAANYFAKTPKLDSLSARHLIAKQLINNNICTVEQCQKSIKNEVQLSTVSSWSPSTKIISRVTGQL